MLMRLVDIVGPDRVVRVLCGVVPAFARSTFCATSWRETLLIGDGYSEPISATQQSFYVKALLGIGTRD
jgi:hypothetical protein